MAIVLSIVFVVHISSYSPQYKSDMRDVGGEMTPLLHQGDLVVDAQPDSTPLAWYYLPGGPAATPPRSDRSGDPSYMDWVYALKRLQQRQPRADRSIRWLLASSPASSCCTCDR